MKDWYTGYAIKNIDADRLCSGVFVLRREAVSEAMIRSGKTHWKKFFKIVRVQVNEV